MKKEDILSDMETTGNDNTTEEWPTSPYKVLQHISGEAVRVAGEALQGVYLGNGNSKIHPSVLGHRRTHSEVVPGLHRRTNSFQKLKSHMQRALHWGNSSREQGPAFNPEVLANQKRQWYQLHSNSLDNKKYHEPTSLFEHFAVVGLHPECNLELVEDAFSKSKRWEMDKEKYEMVDVKLSQKWGPTSATLEPQILFKYPPGKRLAVRPKDLAAFCFPWGVKARVLERTPSFSDLNELIYGQEHLSRDDLSFIFSLKVADNATLYGVCLQVQEIVQKPPAILVASSLRSQSSGQFSRFLVSAPRCYCVLTRVPFFELHYEMLKSIIAQDRLNRITQFVSQMSLADCIPSTPKLLAPMNENLDSSFQGSGTDWMASAIPVDDAIALTAAAAGILIDDSLQTSCRWSLSPESCTTSESSDHSPTKDVDKDDRKFMQSIDDCASEASDNPSDCFERIYSSNGNGIPPAAAAYICHRSRTLEHLDSFESLFSPVKNMLSDDDEDDIFLNPERETGDDIIMDWARENKNDSLQIVCGYHSLPLPDRGGEIVFQPLDHLQGIEYRRPPVYTLGLRAKYLDHKLHWSSEDPEVNMKLAAGEEALALAIWTSATICRVLSLESVLAFFTGVLLEKQVVVVCPNLGVLSAIVLSVIPMIRPFEWQSLFLPILPERMLDFLDAPVPFIVGVQHKPSDRKMKASNLVHVNVVKDQVKARYIPTLPRYKELVSELRPIHAKLASENCIAQRHPVYKCNEVQAEAAAHFSAVMRRYLESLCSDLRSHTITSVQSNNDRVSLLLKDSFIDSFPSKDQPFIKLFVDTQLFTVMTDSRLSTYESEG